MKKTRRNTLNFAIRSERILKTGIDYEAFIAFSAFAGKIKERRDL